jgi:hypothetical protein
MPYLPLHISLGIKKLSFLFSFLLISFFSLAQYPEITAAINNAGKNELQSLDQVISFIQSHGKNDHEKAYGVYFWIAHNVKYDVKGYIKNLSSYSKPEDVFKKRKAICKGYSMLYEYMCTKLNLECRMITGYSKGASYKNGQAFTWSNHGWNAVKLDSVWYLIDVTWASGSLKGHKFKPSYNTSYFKANPQSFVVKHLPETPMWQLLENPLSLKTFAAGDKKITEELKQYPTPRFHYNDSIQLFLKQDSIQQTLDEGYKAMVFNPVNTSPLAFAMLNSTIYEVKKDSLNFRTLSLHDLDSLIKSTNVATELLLKAKGSHKAFNENVEHAAKRSYLISGTLYYYKSEYLKKNANLDSMDHSFDSLISYYNVYLLTLEKSVNDYRKSKETKILKVMEPNLCYQYIRIYRKYTDRMESENDATEKKAIQKERALLVSRAKRSFPPDSKYYKTIKERLK